MGFWDQLKKAASGRRLLDSIDAVEDAVRSTDRAEALRMAKEDYQRRGALLDPQQEPFEAPVEAEASSDALLEIEEEAQSAPSDEPSSSPRMGAPNAPQPFEIPSPLHDPQTEERFYEIEISDDDRSLPSFADISLDPKPEITLEGLDGPPTGEVEEEEVEEEDVEEAEEEGGEAFDDVDTFIRREESSEAFDEQEEPTAMMTVNLAPLRDVDTADLPAPGPISEEVHSEEAVDPEVPSSPAPYHPSEVLYPNSLGLSDRDVVRILREENYPHLDEVRDEQLCALSRIESLLVERAEAAGLAFLSLHRILDDHPLWLAALWFTGMHRDPMIREGLRRLNDERSAQAARWLGWAIWPYAFELRGAAAGLDDPREMCGALDALEEALGEREALIRCSNPQMSVERHRFPVTLQGVFRRRGFRWSPSS